MSKPKQVQRSGSGIVMTAWRSDATGEMNLQFPGPNMTVCVQYASTHLPVLGLRYELVNRAVMGFRTVDGEVEEKQASSVIDLYDINGNCLFSVLTFSEGFFMVAPDFRQKLKTAPEGELALLALNQGMPDPKNPGYLKPFERPSPQDTNAPAPARA